MTGHTTAYKKYEFNVSARNPVKILSGKGKGCIGWIAGNLATRRRMGIKYAIVIWDKGCGYAMKNIDNLQELTNAELLLLDV